MTTARRAFSPIGVAMVAALALIACPPSEKKTASDSGLRPPPACAHVGQSCEVSPGKLGTCVLRDGCTEPPPACFVCQSQH